MVIEYSKCDNCPHAARDHDDRTGRCWKKGCSCPGFKPKGS